MKYIVKVSKIAKSDIIKVYDYIEQMLFAPSAAEDFLRGIYACIAKLETHADIFAVSTFLDVLHYGKNARTVHFKNWIVIYTIHGRFVLVHRIIHDSLFIK